MESVRQLVSTLTNRAFPFDQIHEFTEDGESLEVYMPGLADAHIRPGRHLWERFADWMPFTAMDADLSLGEGNTALVRAGRGLQALTGLRNLQLKNETQNPTWSFKDRGSLACLFLARELGETTVATISSGNMGHSIAAYAARAGLSALVFVPAGTVPEKVRAMALHGARVVAVRTPGLTELKQVLRSEALRLNLRIVSGNGPVRVEGYKLTAFELHEQLGGEVPDFIAVPTSACGHLRGIFKGYRELRATGLIDRLPRMIVVQAAQCNPLVNAIRQGLSEIVPVRNVRTIAQAIAGGDPPGGNEILVKAREHGWLASDAPEAEILEGQRVLAGDGFFVEPATATLPFALKRLVDDGHLPPEARVVALLTGSGLKDQHVLASQPLRPVLESGLDTLGTDLERLLG
jgi:threonine synthase